MIDDGKPHLGEPDEHVGGKGALIVATVAPCDQEPGAVIEDGVDAGDLLQGGDGDGKQEGAAKAAQPSGNGSFLGAGSGRRRGMALDVRLRGHSHSRLYRLSPLCS